MLLFVDDADAELVMLMLTNVDLQYVVGQSRSVPVLRCVLVLTMLIVVDLQQQQSVCLAVPGVLTHGWLGHETQDILLIYGLFYTGRSDR